MEELKRCPFCNGKAELQVNYPKSYASTGFVYVQCTVCSARSKSKAIAYTITSPRYTNTDHKLMELPQSQTVVRAWNSRWCGDAEQDS